MLSCCLSPRGIHTEVRELEQGTRTDGHGQEGTLDTVLVHTVQNSKDTADTYCRHEAEGGLVSFQKETLAPAQ